MFPSTRAIAIVKPSATGGQMAGHTVYSVGRAPDNDICIDRDTVSRKHAEIVVTSDDQLYFSDCGSTWGTLVWRSDAWRPIRQGYVGHGEIVRLGDFESSAGELLRRAPPPSPGAAEAPRGTGGLAQSP